jgi:hypothetical protein
MVNSKNTNTTEKLLKIHMKSMTLVNMFFVVINLLEKKLHTPGYVFTV